MKRILLVCMAVCIILTNAVQAYASPMSGNAQVYSEAEDDTADPEKDFYGDEVPDFLYELNEEGGLTLTAYTGSASEPEIPAEIDGKPVTAIGDSCFAGNLFLERIHVPEGVTRIGNYAFECCSVLKKIYLPDSVRSIGDGAFSGCISLILADIQEGLETIGRGAFLICTSLVYLDLPESLTGIGPFACAGCTSLANVTFHGDLVTEVPDRLFDGCAKLATVILSGGVTVIGDRSFSGCESLTYLYAEKFLSRIGKYAFNECSMLKSVDLGAQAIEEAAFSGCGAMNYIYLKDGTESIGYRAFMSTGIRNLDIPASVSDIAEGAFVNSKITGISLEDETNFKMIGTSLYSADGKTLITCFPEDPYSEDMEEEIVIPDGTETISAYAFSNVWGASRVIFPDSVKRICARAFSLSTISEAEIPADADVDPDAFLESAMEVYEEETSAPDDERESEDTADDAQAPEFIGSSAGERSLLHEGDFEGYLQISNDEFDAWSEKYVDYVSRYYPVSKELMPYIMMYKGETVAHYVPMTYVQNHDPAMYQRAVSRFGEGFEEMYQMMNHGLFTELRRGRMCDDLVLYSGVYDSQLMAAAGTDEVPALEQLADAVGSEFSDPCMISTTTDPAVACNFSDTLFIIYASKEAMEDLGAVSIDSIIHTHEKEILMCENARYRLLDVGTMAVESTDGEGQPVTLYRDYVTVELLGGSE